MAAPCNVRNPITTATTPPAAPAAREWRSLSAGRRGAVSAEVVLSVRAGVRRSTSVSNFWVTHVAMAAHPAAARGTAASGINASSRLESLYQTPVQS